MASAERSMHTFAGLVQTGFEQVLRKADRYEALSLPAMRLYCLERGSCILNLDQFHANLTNLHTMQFVLIGTS